MEVLTVRQGVEEPGLDGAGIGEDVLRARSPYLLDEEVGARAGGVVVGAVEGVLELYIGGPHN